MPERLSRKQQAEMATDFYERMTAKYGVFAGTIGGAIDSITDFFMGLAKLYGREVSLGMFVAFIERESGVKNEVVERGMKFGKELGAILRAEVVTIENAKPAPPREDPAGYRVVE